MFSFNKSLLPLANLGVLVIALTVLLSPAGSASTEREKQPRKFYLTPTTQTGSEALTACAAGYHMAALWEIFDTSNLRYDTQLGRITEDSGFGPPAESGVAFTGRGWIRTGVNGTDGTEAGSANCEVWTSASATVIGSAVSLNDLWTSNVVTVTSPWRARTEQCSFPLAVWCVQD